MFGPNNPKKNDINDLFSLLGSSSLVSHKPNINISEKSKKPPSTNTNININTSNNIFKSFSYQEDKNLKYRQSMEDFGAVCPNLTEDNKTSLFAIFDGHGGNDVVKYIKDRVPEIIKNNLKNSPIELAIEDSFTKIDEELKFYDSEYTGSTATVLLIQNNKIYCANVGDSSAYIIYENDVKKITVDHKCSVEEEANRIINMGGKITKNRVMGQLVLSRCLGDFYVKKYGVINTPYMSINDLGYDVKNVVIASDGVWDVIDENCLLDLCKKYRYKSAEDLCKNIVKEAIDKETKDNVSCIVVTF